jgi:hypothetical protein
LKKLFDKENEIKVMEIEKELISLYLLSFERIKFYLAHVKELQLKFGECGKNFPKKGNQLIELIFMHLKT